MLTYADAGGAQRAAAAAAPASSSSSSAAAAAASHAAHTAHTKKHLMDCDQANAEITCICTFVLETEAVERKYRHFVANSRLSILCR